MLPKPREMNQEQKIQRLSKTNSPAAKYVTNSIFPNSKAKLIHYPFYIPRHHQKHKPTISTGGMDVCYNCCTIVDINNNRNWISTFKLTTVWWSSYPFYYGLVNSSRTLCWAHQKSPCLHTQQILLRAKNERSARVPCNFQILSHAHFSLS